MNAQLANSDSSSNKAVSTRRRHTSQKPARPQQFLVRDFVAVRNFENKVTRVPTLDIAGLAVKNYHQVRIHNNNMDL